MAVKTLWGDICIEEQTDVAKVLDFLTLKQRQLLKEIACNQPLFEPTAKSFVDKVNLTPRGINNALNILYKHDLVEKSSSGEITILDPILEYWLKR